jgi:drug/metabolite transporter (DMT)-like permease
MSTRWKADLLLAVCALIWGATFVIVKDALADASVFAFLAARFVLAAIVMAVIFWRVIRATNRAEILAGIWIGCFMFAGYAFQTVGLVSTTPSKAAFITGSSVVLVPIFHGILWRSKIRLFVWMGAFAALGGLYLLTVPASGLAQLNRGDLLVCGCAISFAFHICFAGHFSAKHSYSALSFHETAVTATLSLFAIPAASAAGLESVRFHSTQPLLMAVGVTAFLATALAFSIQLWAQQHTSAAHTAIIFSLEPVFAGVTSYVWFGERLSARALAGAGLILGGIVIAELKSGAPVAPESPIAQE